MSLEPENLSRKIRASQNGSQEAQLQIYDYYKNAITKYQSFLGMDENEQERVSQVFQQTFQSMEHFTGSSNQFAIYLFEVAKNIYQDTQTALPHNEYVLLALLAFFEITIEEAAEAMGISISQAQETEKKIQEKLSQQLTNKKQPQKNIQNHFSEAETQAVPTIQPLEVPQSTTEIQKTEPTVAPPLESNNKPGISKTAILSLVALLTLVVVLFLGILQQTEKTQGEPNDTTQQNQNLTTSS